MLEKLTAKQQQWVDETFAKLTLDEKIGQLVNETGGSILRKKGDAGEWFRKYPIGSIFTGSEVIDSFSEKRAIGARLTQAVEAAKLTVPMLYSGDFENGLGANIEGFTVMPRMMGVSSTFSRQDCYDYGKVIGTEGRAMNIRWGFGPVSDLNLNRENPVTNIRSAGDDPDHSIMVVKNIVKGMQECGMASCPKHFPGDGTDTRNQHYVTSLNLLSKAEWDKNHGRVFRELIEAGAMSIMIGHIGFPAYEEIDEKSGKFRPATCSKRLMTDLLRGELGFDGIILTDALCMNGYLSWADYETRILDSFNGGADVFLWPEAEKFFPLMKAALADGRASMERLDESVRRILSFKALLGLTPEEMACEPETDIEALLRENGKTARRIAADGITLLRNRDKVLPLKLKKGSRVLVFLSPDKPAPIKFMQKFITELEDRGLEVTQAKAKDYFVLAKTIDVFDAVFYLSDANPQYTEYRGFDMVFWDFLPDRNMRNLVMISFGTPYFLYDVAEAATYINAYHDCEASVIATVQAMFGEIPFKGKSPVSVPHCFDFGDGLTL